MSSSQRSPLIGVIILLLVWFHVTTSSLRGRVNCMHDDQLQPSPSPAARRPLPVCSLERRSTTVKMDLCSRHSEAHRPFPDGHITFGGDLWARQLFSLAFVGPIISSHFTMLMTTRCSGANITSFSRLAPCKSVGYLPASQSTVRLHVHLKGTVLLGAACLNKFIAYLKLIPC
jgi:hypothetical protein